ncbi:hypothetical protein MCP1_100124 [Candidatus Terasakiella magnetica]|nr:hypothetical protein MCP1_100124 [Candidatus Terasakiella magnetica]
MAEGHRRLKRNNLHASPGIYDALLRCNLAFPQADC